MLLSSAEHDLATQHVSRRAPQFVLHGVQSTPAAVAKPGGHVFPMGMYFPLERHVGHRYQRMCAAVHTECLPIVTGVAAGYWLIESCKTITTKLSGLQLRFHAPVLATYFDFHRRVEDHTFWQMPLLACNS